MPVAYIDAGVSCNACVMISFSDQSGISSVKNRLAEIRPGLLRSLELERITLFPKVNARLKDNDLKPNSIRKRIHTEDLPIICDRTGDHN